jgi:enoyl-[acyl-carrier protein] reductase / trans-2-enoyl-CoA reductase (NAD+)
MIIKPKFRGFICTTAHPEGCAHNVKQQIEYVKERKKINGAKKVLVIGGSAGFGLASRIVSTFACGAATIGVFWEKAASGNKTATAGWYNTAAFEKAAKAEGIYAKSVNGDAFSNEIKEKTIELIKKDLGKVDMVIYSLASPRRNNPVDGNSYISVLKPIGKNFVNKNVDFHTGEIKDVVLEAATEEEINNTVKVMGGEDWELWIDALAKAGVLEKGVTTLAYSYIGPEITKPIYNGGTIGRAKDHLDITAQKMNEKLKVLEGKALVSVNKALVTQASSAIPVVPLYISLLYKAMKTKGIHEGCIEQIYRLFEDRLYSGDMKLDEVGRIRVDDWEMREDVQKEVTKLWPEISTETLESISDIKGFRSEFFNLFGFDFKDIDYEKEIEENVIIEDIVVI